MILIYVILIKGIHVSQTFLVSYYFPWENENEINLGKKNNSKEEYFKKYYYILLLLYHYIYLRFLYLSVDKIFQNYLVETSLIHRVSYRRNKRRS